MLIVSKHDLYSLIFASQNDIVATGVFFLAYLPRIPLGRQAILPALHYHLLHLFLQILSNTP